MNDIALVVTSKPSEAELIEISKFLSEAGIVVRELNNRGRYSVSIGGSIVVESCDTDDAYPDIVIQYHFDQFKVVCMCVDFEFANVKIASTTLNDGEVGTWLEINDNVKMYDLDGKLLEFTEEEDDE